MYQAYGTNLSKGLILLKAVRELCRGSVLSCVVRPFF